MDYLLDTNIFLWWLNGDIKLKPSILKEIKNPDNKIFISIASAWEISIKNRKGKLPLKTTLKECIEISDFQPINITLSHILRMDILPLHHKDPFDRLLIAQAIAESLTLIASDKKIWQYDVSVLKA